MGTIDVAVFAAKQIKKKKRAAPAITAKDTVPYVAFLGELPSGDVVVVEAPDSMKSMGRLVRRRAADFTVEKSMNKVRGPAALSPSGKFLLVTGPIFHGRDASCLLVDVDKWKVVRKLPLIAPFVWIDDTHFVAQTPGWDSDIYKTKGARGPVRKVDPKIARGEEHWMTDTQGMALVDLERETSTLLLESHDLDWECVAVLSPDRRIVYSSGDYSRVSATRLADGKLLWQNPPNELIQEGSVRAMAFDRVGGQIVTAGGGELDFVTYDAKTGAIRTKAAKLAGLALAGFPRANRFETIAVRSDGGFALATEKGTIVDLPPNGQPWEAYQAASRGIRAMTFIRNGRELVVGGAEKNLRRVPYGGEESVASDPRARPSKAAIEIKRAVPADEELAEEWVRVTRERNVQGVSAVKARKPSAWPWQVYVSAMEFVREPPLEKELRRQVVSALRSVPTVKKVKEEDREVWVVSGAAKGNELVSAVSAVVDAMSDRIRDHIKSLRKSK